MMPSSLWNGVLIVEVWGLSPEVCAFCSVSSTGVWVPAALSISPFSFASVLLHLVSTTSFSIYPDTASASPVPSHSPFNHAPQSSIPLSLSSNLRICFAKSPQANCSRGLVCSAKCTFAASLGWNKQLNHFWCLTDSFGRISFNYWSPIDYGIKSFLCQPWTMAS